MTKLALLATLITACYQPAEDANCTLACATEEACPVGYVCTGGRCATAAGACAIDPDGGVTVDGAAEVCAGTGLLGSKCFTATSTIVLTSAPAVVATDVGGQLCHPDEIDACFVVGISIVIADTAAITVVGSRPLVLWSATTIVINGILDAGSSFASKGPFANPPNCDVIAGGENGAVIPGIGGGGAGGSNNNLGGDGGDGRTGATIATTLGPSNLQNASALRGGCPGGNGGFSDGTGGSGGGAVYMIAHDAIRIAGVVNASGAGGGGGVFAMTQLGGGGGGGSGGMIGIDAPMIVYDGANVLALGGGGGSGASAIAGNKGFEPDIQFATQGQGGPQTTTANAGGAGGPLAGTPAGGGGSVLVNNQGGGGGGGGGAGYILEFGVATSVLPSNIHPPPGP